MTVGGGFRKMRNLQPFPSLAPYPFDPRVKTFNPEGSIEKQHIKSVSPHSIQGIGIKVYRSSDQAPIADSTDTPVSFNAVAFREGFADPGSSFTTVKVPHSGVYFLIGQVEAESNNLTDPQVWFTVNGTGMERMSVAMPASPAARIALPAARRLTEGDTVGLSVRHNAGSNRTINGGEENLALTLMFLGQF